MSREGVRRQAHNLATSWWNKQKPKPLTGPDEIAPIVFNALEAGDEPDQIFKALDKMTAFTPKAMQYCLDQVARPGVKAHHPPMVRAENRVPTEREKRQAAEEIAKMRAILRPSSPPRSSGEQQEEQRCSCRNLCR